MLLINDTQNYGGNRGHIFEAMTDWIKAEAEENMDIACAIHTGDVLASGDHTASAACVERIAAALPLVMVAGNHDVGKDATNYTRFLSYFPYLSQADAGLTLKDGGRALFYTFEAGGARFIVIGTGWIPRKSDIAWINEQLTVYSDHYAILVTHSYLRQSGGRTSTGERLFTQVVAKNANVRLVLCGHKHDCRVETAMLDDDGGGTAERQVYEVISNYQDLAEGGSGYLRILTFDTAENTITVESYSPYLDAYNALGDESDSFMLTTDFSFAMTD